ncbi:hypothetical protein PT974_04982 [Cladobotryum mycophilum]|uniref:Uncharacterized protein n=1 Tax=Cladobotryum mycophilum TaxID=491253 RepID=A0ABR0SS04_9HYPO
MFFKSTTTALALALASGLSQVAGQICAIDVKTTHAGLSFYLYDDSIPTNNYRPLQLRPSKDGKFHYVALDNSSPPLVANIDNGVLVAESKATDGTLFDLGLKGFLYNYTTIPLTRPTTIGQLAFANTSTFANASDPDWFLRGASGYNTYNLWRNEPVNTLNGVQICEAKFDLNEDGTPWYYFQYVDWVSYYPEECEFVAVLTNVSSTDQPTC